MTAKNPQANVELNAKLPMLPAQLFKRRVLALASATAAVALGGCGFIDLGDTGTAQQPMIVEPDSRPVVLTPQQATAKKAEEFTANVDAALAKKPGQVILANAQTNTPATAAPAPEPSPVKPAEPATPAATVSKPVTATPSPTVAVTPAAAKPPTPAPVETTTPMVGNGQVSTAVISPLGRLTETSSTLAMSSATASTPALSEPGSPTASVQPGEPSIDQVLDTLRKRIAAKPSLNTALALALLESSEGKAADTSETKDLSTADQKVFTDLLSALQTMTPAAPSTTVSDRAAPLVAAAKKWEADADLQLPKLVLASRVDSSGVFSAVDAKFEAGKRHTVIIYCEVANFATQKGDDNWFTTRLAQQETLITEDGLLVWRPNPEEIEDRSMNQRRDFYLVKKLTIPENLAIGKYTLRMSVTDKNTNKIAMMSLPLEIVGK